MSKIVTFPPRPRDIAGGHLRLSVSAQEGAGPLTDGMPDTPGAMQLGLSELTALTLGLLQPGEVLCWLFCADYDACDVADRLAAADYRGRLTVCAPGLPSIAGVARELSRAYPTLDLWLTAEVPLSPQAQAYAGRMAMVPAPA